MGIFENNERGKVYEENYYSLFNSIKLEEKCCFFLGAGLPHGIGYPDWESLIESLIAEVKMKKGKIIKFDKNKLKEKADECKSELDVKDYENFLFNTFHDNALPQFNSIYTHITNLPVKYFITTNYDNCLEKTICSKNNYDVSKINCFYYPDLNPTFPKDYSVFHLHGGINYKKPQKSGLADRFILTKSDYINAYVKKTLIRDFLIPIFTHNKIIFIGSKIEEDIRKLLRESKSKLEMLQKEIENTFHTPVVNKFHYAILPFPSSKNSNNSNSLLIDVHQQIKNDNQLEELNIKPIRYQIDEKRESHFLLERLIIQLNKLMFKEKAFPEIESSKDWK